jgi:hypothetical protein
VVVALCTDCPTGEQKWEALSLEEKRKVLGDTRNFLLTMGSGTVSTLSSSHNTHGTHDTTRRTQLVH